MTAAEIPPAKPPRPPQTISLRLKLMVSLLVGALMIGCAGFAVHAYQSQQRALRVLAVTNVSRELFAARQAIRYERGTVDRELMTAGPRTADDTRNLVEARADTAARLTAMLDRLKALAPDSDPFGRADISRDYAAVEAFNPAIQLALAQPPEQRGASLDSDYFSASSRLIDDLNSCSERLSAAITRNDPFITAMTNIGQLAWLVREAVGNEMLLLNRAAASGHGLSSQEQADYNALTGRADAPWGILEVYTHREGAPPSLAAAIARANHLSFDLQRRMHQRVYAELAAGRPSPLREIEMRRIDSQGVVSLLAVAGTAFDLAANQAANQASMARRQFIGSLTIMAAAFAFGLVSILFINGDVLRPIARITAAMRDVANGDLERAIPDRDRRDEVGELARALGVFRENAVAKQRIDEELIRARVAKEAAEAAALAEAQFLANMSHEIRTPLTGVLGFASLLDGMDGLPDKARGYVGRITGAGRALLAIVNDILDFSRLEVGRIELDPQPFALEPCLRDCLGLFAAEAANKGVSLRYEPAADLPTTVLADSGRLRQVLLNLLGNALKFTKAGSVRLVARRDGGRADRLRFEIVDTGMGIPQAQVGRLFQRFSQVDASNTRAYGGAGLGLAICKGLTDIMGGEIGVESTPDQGSTFWFTVAAPEVESRQPVAGAERDDWIMPPLKILVVDDVAVNRELVSAILSAFDIEITEAANGLEAVEASLRTGFDLILMDLQMPRMDGLAATQAIRANADLNRATPILALSANVMPAQVEACRRAGMNDHIGKPINPSELMSKIAQWTEPQESREIA